MAASAKGIEGRRAARLGPQKRRPLVLDVAFELFLQHGYRGTSMDAVARAAGVSKPVIYACFASKAELFGALLDREEQRMLAQFGAALASSAATQDVPSMLASGFVSMLRGVQDTPELYRIALFGLGGTEAAIEARVRHGRSNQVAAVAQLARAWLAGRELAGGELASDRLEATARFVGETLVAIGEAGVRTLLGGPGEWTPEVLGELLSRFACAGFASLLGDAAADLLGQPSPSLAAASQQAQ
ncbi:MAG TPA: helix-turn-helix domain-containing protein [Solirubrobacteraceae bacterium]|jgi:AcrR family transcriptional regulator|nr:helix-turn-helix domain-containing protein [Solirubrobacteraceae bacterium]